MSAAPLHQRACFSKVTRLRDACILLAGHRCYREHPRTWVERQLAAHGFKVLGTEELPILYSEHAVRRQLNVARTKLPLFKDARLKAAMKASIDELDRRVAATIATQHPSKRIKQGFDYVIAAEIDPAFVRPGRPAAAGAAGAGAAAECTETPCMER